jgi:hypothetical protein
MSAGAPGDGLLGSPAVDGQRDGGAIPEPEAPAGGAVDGDSPWPGPYGRTARGDLAVRTPNRLPADRDPRRPWSSSSAARPCRILRASRWALTMIIRRPTPDDHWTPDRQASGPLVGPP